MKRADEMPVIRRRSLDPFRRPVGDRENDPHDFPVWMEITMRVVYVIGAVALLATIVYQCVFAALRNHWFV
jgi:hypothetical protein